MERLEIRPFSDEHAADAATLLAACQERHVARQPLLSTRYDFRAEIEALWTRPDASGRAAFADGRLTGYVIGWSRSADRRGPNSPRVHDEDVRAFVRDQLASSDACDLLAEVDGRIVGILTVKPTEGYDTHAGIASPPGAALLAFAVTDPRVRGSGAAVALTHAGIAWARGRGHDTMVVDWREANLQSSRFWPRRGSERTFVRVHRSIA